jgi:hypothetical protein
MAGPNPTLTLVANSKMGEMILFTPASEDQRYKVDSCAETPTSVDESRLEQIRHHVNIATTGVGSFSFRPGVAY